MNMSFVLRLPREMHLNVPRLPWFLEMPSPPAPPHPLIFCNRRPLLPTPIPFAFSISINDLGSYVLLSSYFFLGTAALPPAPPHPLLCLIRLPFLPSLIPSCHEHRLFDFILFFLIFINIHGN